jgi:hypothetical protein
MCGAIPPHPQYAFMAWCLVKHRDSFAFFTFTILRLYNDCAHGSIFVIKKRVKVKLSLCLTKHDAMKI